MDPRSQAFLETILKKELHELNQEEIDFLKARRSYLNEEQTKKYLEVKEEPKTEDMPYKDMMQKARDMGFKVKVGLKRAELEAMINSVVN